jgi:DNA-binding winged helix-turn-helix (wHTH) protein
VLVIIFIALNSEKVTVKFLFFDASMPLIFALLITTILGMIIGYVGPIVRRHRRGEAKADVGPLVAGELEIRPDQFEAYVAARPLGLTRREFELLHTLAGASGRVLERDDIYQRVWGYAMAHGDRSVDVFVRKLRSKLQQQSPEWQYIHTHFGIGYRFEAESASLDVAPASTEAVDVPPAPAVADEVPSEASATPDASTVAGS